MLFLSKYDLAKILIPSCLHDYNILKFNFMNFICSIESYSYYMVQLFLSPLEHSSSKRLPDPPNTEQLAGTHPQVQVLLKWNASLNALSACKQNTPWI